MGREIKLVGVMTASQMADHVKGQPVRDRRVQRKRLLPEPGNVHDAEAEPGNGAGSVLGDGAFCFHVHDQQGKVQVVWF